MPKASAASSSSAFEKSLCGFADSVTKTWKLKATMDFQPEDQLKAPVMTLIKSAGVALKLSTDCVTELHEKELSGRPDVGVTVDSLLTGHVELKAPGKGADPTKFKGANKAQWEKFKDLPNLIYTDGNAWTLFRSGERVGNAVRMDGDITEDGQDAVGESSASKLFDLLRDFLFWQPIVPSNPKALANLLAPLCRLLRTDVAESLTIPESPLQSLAADWRAYLFPDATDHQFADSYAQTFTYALLLARLSGADDLSIGNASQTIKVGHRLLADTLKILGDDAARHELAVPIDMLERVLSAVDVTQLTKKANGDPWLYFYEEFLAAYDPKMRADRGVFYTPVEIILCQVRLVSALLEKHFDAEFGFVDPHVVTLDPAAGTASYVLTAIQESLNMVEATRGAGMRASAASTAANNVHAFELLVGPYAVGHLRLTQQILAEGGSLPPDGVHVYLTDTLEAPHAVPPGHLPLAYKTLGEEHKR